jgi:predicted MFS family arabinose efflux permease
MSGLRALPLLAAAGFASMVSMRMCDAMLPALAQAFDAQAAETAQVVSAFALAYGLLQLAYGPLGDRFGKPRVISMATLACSGAALAAALSPTLDMLTASRVLMGGAAAGIIPLTMAWIGDQVPYAQRQEVLARLLGSTVLGMMAGSWAGGAVAQAAGWRAAFFAVAVLFFALATILWLGHGRRSQSLGAPRGTTFVRELPTVLRSPWSRSVLAVAFIEGAMVFGALAFVPSVLHARFQLSLSEAGGIAALFGLGGLLYSRVAGRLLRWLGAPTLAGLGATGLAIAFLGLAAMPHWAFSVPACLIAGIGFYMLHNTLQTCATQLSVTARGTAVSMFVCALFLGQAIGVALAAWFIDMYSAASWFAVAGPALLVLGMYFALRLRRRSNIGEAVALLGGPR